MVFEVIVHFLFELQSELAKVCLFPQTAAVLLHLKHTLLLFTLPFSFIFQLTAISCLRPDAIATCTIQEELDLIFVILVVAQT